MKKIKNYLINSFHELSVDNDLKINLTRGMIGLSGASVFTLLLTLAMGVVLARMLGAKGFGEYSFSLALISFFILFSQAGFSVLTIRMVATYHGNEKWGLLRGFLIKSKKIILITSSTLILVMLLILFGLKINWPANLPTLVLALFLVPLVSLNNINAAALRGLHHVIWAQLMEPDIRYLIITVSILIIGQFITVNKVETEYAMGINVVGAVLALLIAARILRSKLPQKIYSITPKYETRIWLMSSVPLVLAGGAQLINSQTDLIMLGVFSVSEEVGIYKVSVSLASLAIFFMMVTNTITSPYLAKMHVQGNHASLQKVMKISVTISTILSLPIIIILLLMGSDIIKVVFGAEFSPGSTALSILCIGQFICVSMGSAGVLLNMSGKEKIVMNILLFSALLNVILNAILIPLYGINGAAIGTAISTSIWHILQSLMVYKSLGIISNIFAIIKNQLQPEL